MAAALLLGAQAPPMPPLAPACAVELDLTLVFDVSQIPGLMAFGNELILGENLTKVGAVKFNQAADRLIGLSGDLSQVTAAINGIGTAGGATSISNGMREGLNLMEQSNPREGVRRIMLVLTATANNYNANANTGSPQTPCTHAVPGCTDSYNPAASSVTRTPTATPCGRKAGRDTDFHPPGGKMAAQARRTSLVQLQEATGDGAERGDASDTSLAG